MKEAFNINENRAVLIKEEDGRYFQWEEQSVEGESFRSRNIGHWIEVSIKALLIADEVWGLLKILWALIRATFKKDEELKAEAKLHLAARKALS